MRVADAEGSFAMIDLVAHLYRGTSDDRRALATIWTRYSDATEDERRKKGFEIVRMHHATLTRMFRDDPDGEYLDIDDVRTTWEEFVDALRAASGAQAEAGASTYAALETPVMRRNASFSRLALDLEEVVRERSQKNSPASSNPDTPEGSTRGIERISSRGLLLGVGCSSRDASTRGGNAFLQSSTTVRGEDIARALEKNRGD